MNDLEQAECDRLKAENSYLLSRLVEMEARLNVSIDRLGVAVEHLSKVVKPTHLPRLLTPEQAAEILQVTPGAVYKWISQKRIPFRRVGSRPRLLLEELLDWTVPMADRERASRHKKQPRPT